MKTYLVEVQTAKYNLSLVHVSRKDVKEAFAEFKDWWRTSSYEKYYGETQSLNLDLISETQLIRISNR